MSPARKRLKEATAAVVAIQAQIDQLTAAAESSASIVENAKAQIEKFSGLDKEVTRFRVDAVKRGIGTQSIPDFLKEKLAAKRDAEEELDQAEETGKVIAQELETAKANLRPAESAQRVEAASVLWEFSNDAAAELTALNVRQSELVQILRGLGEMYIEGDTRIGYSPAIEAALIRRDLEFSPDIDPRQGMAQRWKIRFNALLSDPAAILQLPKALGPEDFERYVDYPGALIGRIRLRPEA